MTNPLLAVAWVTCGAIVVTAAIRSRRHPEALRIGRIAVAVLYIPFGAMANALFVLRGDSYDKFADGAYVVFVKHTWHTLVAPNTAAWISLLIVFELGVGVLALAGGRRTQLGYAAAIAFHVALLSFGFGFLVWAIPMIGALTTLLRAERAPTPARVEEGNRDVLTA